MANVITCNTQEMTDEQFLNSILVKDASGAVHINWIVTNGSCGSVSRAATCEGFMPVKDVIGALKRAGGLDACGRPGVRVFVGS
jgi:hypothetical protein